MQPDSRHLGRPSPVADSRADPLQDHGVDEARGEHQAVARDVDQRQRAEPPEKSPRVMLRREVDRREDAADDDHRARDGRGVAAEDRLPRGVRGQRVEEAVAGRHIKRNDGVRVRVETPAEGEDDLAGGGDEDAADDLPCRDLRAADEEPEEGRGGQTEGELLREAVAVDEQQRGHEHGGRGDEDDEAALHGLVAPRLPRRWMVVHHQNQRPPLRRGFGEPRCSGRLQPAVLSIGRLKPAATFVDQRGGADGARERRRSHR